MNVYCNIGINGKIPHQVIITAIKLFFGKLNSYYTLITKPYRFKLLLIKFSFHKDKEKQHHNK